MVRRAKRVLEIIDRNLAIMGAPAWKRQQLRRDIVTSDKAWVHYLDLFDPRGQMKK